MSKIGKCFKMSKLDSLVSVMERAEKQALALFLVGESKQNDSTALSMLRKRGIPEPEQVLELLKQITVDGTENGQPVWSLSNTGKEIQPLAGWYCSTWNEGDDVVQARERVADTVHKMYQIPSARNADLTKVWLANRDLTAFEAWLTKMYEKDKAKGNIADAENGEKVNVRAYEFPKKMLAYSDKYVDCYRADTPADAMLLGNGYGFCISRKDGSNMFYSYRMNPITTAYFCWFKDEQGKKNHKNMIVLHVGEDGKYMATPSQNGPAPRISAKSLLGKYPKLAEAIKHLDVKPVTEKEKYARRYYGIYSTLRIGDVQGVEPDNIELAIAQGTKLDDEAFEYIFKEIDKGNLRTGNNGNSLIKKYIEGGVHPLSVNQDRILREAGYENEIARALEVYYRGRIAAGRRLSEDEFDLVLNDIDKRVISDKTLIGEYLRHPEILSISSRQEEIIASVPGGVDALNAFTVKSIGGLYGCSVRILKNKVVFTLKDDQFKLGELLHEYSDFLNKVNKPIVIASSKKSEGCYISIENEDALIPKVSFSGFKEKCEITYIWGSGIKGSCNYLDFPSNIRTFSFILSENAKIAGIPVVNCERDDKSLLSEGIRVECTTHEHPELELFDIGRQPNSLDIDNLKVKDLKVFNLSDRMHRLNLRNLELESFAGIPKDKVDNLIIEWGSDGEHKVDVLPKEIDFFSCNGDIEVAPKDVSITKVRNANVWDYYWWAKYKNETDYQATYIKEHYTHPHSQFNMGGTVKEERDKYVVTMYKVGRGFDFLGKADKPIVFSDESVSRSVLVGSSFVILDGLPENADAITIWSQYGVYIKELPKSLEVFVANSYVYGVEKLLTLPNLETVILDVAKIRGRGGYTRVDTSILGTSVAEFKKSYEDVIEKLKKRGVHVTINSTTADWLSTVESLSLSPLSAVLNSIID